MQRQLQLIILGHIWALAPVALLWFLRPQWRGIDAPANVAGLGTLALITAGYLVLRTALVLGARLRLAPAFPYVDIALVTGALLIVGNPTDPISVLYFIPLAAAVASLHIVHLAVIAGLAVVSYVWVIVSTHAPWTVGLAYRVVIIVLLGSLYGWIIRVVTSFERAAERAQYRTALAREIHDGIQHTLVTMGARLELARQLVPEAPHRAQRILGEERDALTGASDELRYLVRRLRMAEGGDLPTAMRTQVAALADRWPFALDIDFPPHLPRLSPAAEHSLLRVVQESLTNAAKHAKASAVDVAISAQNGLLTCVIRDDGVGFDPVAVQEGGLAGLRQRVREAGGTLEVVSRPGTGTIVTATFPLQRRGRWQPSVS